MKIGISSPISRAELQSLLKSPIDEIPVGIGGTSVNLLIKSLVSLGHEVIVYTLSPDVSQNKVLKNGKLTIYYGSYTRKFRFIDFFRKEIHDLEKMIAEDPPDIIHAHWTYEFAIAAVKANVPHVITVRDWAPLVLKTVPPYYYRFPRLLMNNWVFSKAKNIVSNSYYMSELISQKYSIKTPIIPNPMNDELLKMPVAERIGEGKKTYIVSVNNGFDDRKNTKELLRAYSIISSKIKDVELYLVGFGYEKGGDAELWARKNELYSENISFLGPLDYSEVMKVIKEATIMIHPSIEESFGNVLVEAMALSIPVIAGKSSGAVPWVLGFGSAGVLTDITDANQIAEKAIELITDKSKYEAFQKSGMSHAIANFELTEVGKKHIDLYESILQKGKSNPDVHI
ncbi:glycosyltransferase family 4 protein [Reinekea marinisedimentorum]|uniref:Glycosyltransferase involved in cell wall biosynthesis n=1 Tax=Reinekea marinisedimentorum TaxID=230495 RepID=A0A4R3I051_9GAMM|nr:glycosyltransferase family 4 protein [Reinekea marinisedimentorum]TCS37169.1 glycosyltransferase involved in cell wall biosynthesis [Reinekea marinisedimentorum]